MTIDEVSGEVVNVLSEEGANRLRAAALIANEVPTACMAPIGLEFVTLQPGERAVLPVVWRLSDVLKVSECSTHPQAPAGLTVLPGPCDEVCEMSLVVENESPLPMTITESDKIAVGLSEDDIPSLESCQLVDRQQETFCKALDWKGGGKDVSREVPSPRDDQTIVIVVHQVPRFAACTPEELEIQWRGMTPTHRITTLTFEDGNVDYVTESIGGKGIGSWVKNRPWCGQTVFTFPKTQQGASPKPDSEERQLEQDDAATKFQKGLRYPKELMEYVEKEYKREMAEEAEFREWERDQKLDQGMAEMARRSSQTGEPSGMMFAVDDAPPPEDHVRCLQDCMNARVQAQNEAQGGGEM